MDTQPILNENKAISYMCSYSSKKKGACFNAMKQNLRKSIEKSQNNFHQIKALTHACASTREGSVQEGKFFLE